jgi:hypothetical protein
VEVVQDGAATAVRLGDETVLIDAPAGTAGGVGRGAGVSGVVCTSGRMERLSGLLEVLRLHPALDLWVPLADDRAAAVGELARQAWGVSVVLDALTPGTEVAVGAGVLSVHGATTDDGGVALGVRLVHGDVTVAYVPRCRVDGAARRLVRGADAVVLEPGAFALEVAMGLAGGADLVLAPVALA